jgi:hypothetical protein
MALDQLIDIDLARELAAYPRQANARTLAERPTEQYITLHYSGVVYADRSRAAELAHIRSEAREHLRRDWGNGKGVYGDGYMYDLVVLSDGGIVRTRGRRQQLWHCGNETGNERSWSVHVLLGKGQDLTAPQRASLFRLFDALRAEGGLGRAAVVGHNEWPRGDGRPQPSPSYRTLFGQSECPGRLIHAHLADYRAAPDLAPYTADSAILGPSRASVAQAVAYMLARPHGEYNAWDIAQAILPAYAEQCAELGIVFEIAVAQLIHETANLSSALSQRRDKDGEHLRNPAGIGVYEPKDQATQHKRPGTVYDADVRGYRPACQFKDWTRQAIPAHLGRLLAYALPSYATPTLAQEAAIRYALGVRDLPDAFRGSAPTLKPLGKAHNPKGAQGAGWASPGHAYGAALARTANEICQVRV